MSKWAGKYVIGITGNIGTGKSVVRKMLEHLGAYGIDADALGHRAIAKGAPGYQKVINTFGNWVIGADDQIDRQKLARLVFSDYEALGKLEAIIHPLVNQAIDYMIQRSSQAVIAIEAIKLIEARISTHCDSVWVSYAPPEVQLVRLMQNRRMTESDARQRIYAQAPQEEKIAKAQVVIKNIGSFEDTWKQVNAAWSKFIPGAAQQPPAAAQAQATEPGPVSSLLGELNIVRGNPRNSADIAAIINRLTVRKTPLTREDIMAAFGEKAYFLLQVGKTMVGVIGWQVENLVSRTLDIVIDPAVSPLQALPVLVNEMEQASRDLQCEASLIFAPPDLAQYDTLWHSLGYERRAPQQLGILAWQEAALESQPLDTVLLFKKLRQDRILRPI